MAVGFGRAELCEAVEDGGADVELSGLAIDVPGHEALAEELEAPHLGFDTTSLVIQGPASPDRPSEATACPWDLVADLRA